ncbi:MAG: hypothetical protein ABJL67_23085 [Sulfitobacter sp.]
MLGMFFALLTVGLNNLPQSDTQDLALVAPSVTEVAPETAAKPDQVAIPDPAIEAEPETATTVQIAPNTVILGDNVQVEGAVAAPAAPAPEIVAVEQGFNMSVVPVGLVPEPQNSTGKFTTAAEIKPILEATKGNWVAVRDYDGKDWLYVTHLWGWRCGLKALAISVNGETMQNWPLPPCHEEYVTPNAILEDDGIPALSFRKDSVRTITIQIVYDDLSMDIAHFERGNVLIP